MRPKVSICIPCYNSEDYIAHAIQSVLGQSFEDFELLVVDNNSTDNTASIVKSFKDRRLQTRRNRKNLGMVGNWNRCLQIARGKYVTILHADDVFHKDMIKRSIEVLESDQSIGFVYTASDYIGTHGNVISRNFPFAKNHVWDGRREFSQLVLRNYVPAASVTARAECYQKFGEFDKRLLYAADWEMWLRICLAGFKAAYIAKPLFLRRYHTGSLTTHFSKHNIIVEDSYRALRLVFGRFDEDKDLVRNTHNALSMLAALSLYTALVGAAKFNSTKAAQGFSSWSRIAIAVRHDFGRDVYFHSLFSLCSYFQDVIFRKYVNPVIARLGA